MRIMRNKPRVLGPNGMPKKLSVGEETFAMQCQAYKLTPVREHKFCADRNWLFDFAWPDRLVAVEVEGGTAWGRSRHSKGEGFDRDCEKYNRAAREGWLVLRYSTYMVISAAAIDEVLLTLAENPLPPADSLDRLLRRDKEKSHSSRPGASVEPLVVNLSLAQFESFLAGKALTSGRLEVESSEPSLLYTRLPASESATPPSKGPHLPEEPVST